MPKSSEHIEKTLEAARMIAEQTKDGRLRAEIVTAIAIVSNDPKDLKAISETICHIDKPLRSEAIVAIAKRLAKAKRFAQARELVMGIPVKDYYWRAEACARIARYSRQASDFGQAKKFALSINTPALQRDIFFDIRRFEQEPDSVSALKHSDSQKTAFADLVRALTRLRELEASAHSDGVYQRAKAFANLANILAEDLRD
jgi:hypothetical protein